MIKQVFYAPPYEDNFIGPRDFAYLAEVDILGWKFRKMKTGALMIETPRVGHEPPESGNLLTVLTPDHQALLQALMALTYRGDEGRVEGGWDNVGS